MSVARPLALALILLLAAPAASAYVQPVFYFLKNAPGPTDGVVPPLLEKLGANVVVEKVFAWPGVGSYALNSLLATDYAPVQGYVLLMACVYVVINTSIDILYALVDPRIRVQ